MSHLARPSSHRLLSALPALLVLAGCASRPVGGATAVAAGDGTARRPASFPTEWRFRPGARAEFAREAMIASNSREASAAGVEILRRGGNAVDAAVAVGYALAVSYPVAGNIGGGGFMVIRLADGRAATIDYREVAPLAATRDMYLDAAGQPTAKSREGHLAVGVPGAVMGMSEALAKFGTKTPAEVMAPAIRLAEEGFLVDSAFWRGLRGDSAKLVTYGGAALFFPAAVRSRRAPGSCRRSSRRRSAASRNAVRASSTRGRRRICWWPRCSAAAG
jgi:gamma-glutamyltranspeptidase/glutathione hydrolase